MFGIIMRVLTCCLSLLVLIGCARSNVPLGTDDNGVRGNTNNSGGDDDANSTGTPMGDSGPGTTGGRADGGTTGTQPNDSGSATMCPAAMCTAPETDLGAFDASNPAASATHSGKGSAFIRLTAEDTNFGGFAGPSSRSGAIGVGAMVTAMGAGKFTVYVRGALASAGDPCLDNGSEPGTAGTTTAIWNGEGPNPSIKPPRVLTIEVKQTEGSCDPWTLTLKGMPCMILAPPLPLSCP